MNLVDYSLILGAFPSERYSAGWLAGSIPAHMIACELNEKAGLGSKVFWYCPVQFGRGLKEADREIFKELMRRILDGELKIGETYKGLRLDKFGYFYDDNMQQIAWRFAVDAIFRGDHFSKKADDKKKYEKYFAFREIYLEKPCPNEYWFLISDIQRIDSPIERKEIQKGKYELSGLKYGDGALFTHHFAYNAVFVSKVPQALTKATRVKSTDEIDSYLKQFFMKKLPNKRLREKVIQQAFAINLMRKFENWSLIMEEKLDCGRPDIIFRDDKGALIVVELKRADNDDPVEQLSKYIHELRVKHKEISGVVVCGKKTRELIEKASKQDFSISVIEYSVSIGFENNGF